MEYSITFFTEQMKVTFVRFTVPCSYKRNLQGIFLFLKIETDDKEADKTSRQREYLLSQVRLPSQETILRYPIEIWVSSGKAFVRPDGM